MQNRPQSIQQTLSCWINTTLQFLQDIPRQARQVLPTFTTQDIFYAMDIYLLLLGNAPDDHLDFEAAEENPVLPAANNRPVYDISLQSVIPAPSSVAPAA